VRAFCPTKQITLDDQLHLGSCTKAMTATLDAMLVEEGKLNWTTTLGELLGDIVKDMHPVWKNVTLQQVIQKL
jgi:CubicO group peptidase (beta-lactamase class C family)